MDKHEIAGILNDIGILLELKGENFFKCKAYYDGARRVETLEEDLEILVNEDRLKDIKGFGKALTEKITRLVKTGSLDYYEKLKESFPSGLLELRKVQGLGPKKISTLYNKLGIKSTDELKKACEEDRLLDLQGFGKKTQEKILESIENLDKYSSLHNYHQAAKIAELLVGYLNQCDEVHQCCAAGSLRRKKEIVKDIDIVASGDNPTKIMDYFKSLNQVEKVINSGETKTSVVLSGGINADLRVVSRNEYPYALHHFTGSKEHNTALRHISKLKGLKINEYGIFKGDDLLECGSEEEIYRLFNMQFIVPELRENYGELEASLEGTLPDLLSIKDIKGVIHVHTTYSDGHNSIDELVKYCMGKGYTYLGITDHSRSAFYAGGLTIDRIKRQHQEIDSINEKYTGFKVFKGIESDILGDGSLDYGEEVLQMFDFVIASIHSGFNMDEEKMTRRIIRAMDNSHTTILGHPTGRLLLMRDPYKVNIDEIINAAAEKNVILEINANPHRLDLDWRYVKTAREKGCRFVISPDAHALEEIDYIAYGVNVARKGWLEAGDVINTFEAERAFCVV